MSVALEMWFGMPLWAAYIVCALVVIPIVDLRHPPHQPACRSGPSRSGWCCRSCRSPTSRSAIQQAIDDWTSFAGRHGDAAGGFDLLLFGIAASILLSLLPQIGEQVDYLRFLPERARA